MKGLAAAPACLSFLVACVRGYVQRPYTASKCAEVRSRKTKGCEDDLFDKARTLETAPSFSIFLGVPEQKVEKLTVF